jgi:lysophospholipase L1-like esterase
MKKFAFLATFALTPALLAPLALAAGPSQLPPNAKLAIIGDSITEQKLYSKYMEVYLVACVGRKDIRVFQFGWSGERAPGFLARMENDLAVLQPTTATTCYGMNDGSYQPYNENIGKTYEDAMRGVAKKFAELGVKNVVFGSPGAVDTKFYKGSPAFPAGQGPTLYNENLAKLGEIDRKLATETGKVYADVHGPMIDAMAKGKQALGENYDVCGGDGVHPGPNGQLIMAYAFLKGLGCDGNLAEISVDMKGSATASEGHKVVSSAPGKVELESSRYPFCLDGDMKSSKSTRSITAFLPFNEELNRFTLKVKNVAGEKAKVTWSGETKEFTKAELEKGVNLAAEFTKTPFDGAFNSYMGAVGTKQAFETGLIKDFVTKFRTYNNDIKADPELGEAFAKLKERLGARHAKLEADSRKALVPVKHTITVE